MKLNDEMRDGVISDGAQRWNSLDAISFKTKYASY